MMNRTLEPYIQIVAICMAIALLTCAGKAWGEEPKDDPRGIEISCDDCLDCWRSTQGDKRCFVRPDSPVDWARYHNGFKSHTYGGNITLRGRREMGVNIK